MESTYPTGEIISKFKEVFQVSSLQYLLVKLGKAPLHCFFVDVPDSDWLKLNWIKTSNFIATNFQLLLNTEFEQWNVYLFFLTQTDIENILQYTIENDTFSSRKVIVRDEFDLEVIIAKNILNKDLAMTDSAIKKPGFKRDKIITSALEPVGNAKKITDGIRSALDQIIEKYRA